MTGNGVHINIPSIFLVIYIYIHTYIYIYIYGDINGDFSGGWTLALGIDHLLIFLDDEWPAERLSGGPAKPVAKSPPGSAVQGGRHTPRLARREQEQ